MDQMATLKGLRVARKVSRQHDWWARYTSCKRPTALVRECRRDRVNATPAMSDTLARSTMTGRLPRIDLRLGAMTAPYCVQMSLAKASKQVYPGQLICSHETGFLLQCLSCWPYAGCLGSAAGLGGGDEKVWLF